MTAGGCGDWQHGIGTGSASSVGAARLRIVSIHQLTRDWVASGWTLPGRLNEHIAATTIIFLGSTNITPESRSISFRIEADLDPSTHIYRPESGSSPHHPFEPLADIYGVVSSSDLGEDNDYQGLIGGPARQQLGTVLTPDGPCWSFPSVMQSRTEAYALLDPTRPGRRRLLRIHLVNPHYRLCSARNTPPQRHEW